ncbi:type II secretory pathway pseudopilin PulG [Aurantimicrobium minutum]|uniref:hypothetical protein n=1 Tax=Aurantimicrobium minutum TaxID=708131 RepID=UPI002476233A|nr:hypothetical protein [Aurantimicrobium minutum]MDH6277212.1 type II secretory pathway pseudopilin PulG [Aurantimicrobium minutum]
MKFTPRVQMIAALAVSTVLVASTAVVVGTNFVSTQQSAQAQVIDTIATGNERVQALTERAADLELAIKNAQTILTDSSGKVLDDASRQTLEKSIVQAQKTLKIQKAELVKLKASVSSLKTAAPLDLLWPYGQQVRAEEVQASDTTSVEALVKAVMALGTGIQNVQTAQSAWQAEQDRIAAEQAAAEAAAAAQAAAAARRAAQAQSLEQTGGSTTPTAPSPPVTAAAAAPVSQGFSAEAYVTALAPNSYVVWENGMCARQFGANVYLCGYATVNLNGSNTDRVPITLDSSLTERYSNSVGVSVLVHEAAHARQWWKYGPSIMTAYNALVPGQTGSMPVEWMADCATIVKLGYSTGSYTRNCTAEQLAEAATLW